MSAVFTTQTFPMGQLIPMIEHGTLGLPELQRPFVWSKSKVRDLFDSLYRGYPVGYFLFWKNATSGARHIGIAGHQASPEMMIVDGQQRLTSLYAVLTGRPIIDENWDKQTVEIAFHPLRAEFAVSDAAICKNPEWLSNITELFKASSDFAFINAYLQRVRERKDHSLSEAQRNFAADAIGRVRALSGFNFQAIILSERMEAEEAAEIFVRINSKGVELNQADFILTLMSVHWDEGRHQLESFSKASKNPRIHAASPFNPYIHPSPDQLLRVAITFGFRRGRMRDGYAILRGRDLKTSEYTTTARDANFKRLGVAQTQVLDLTNWHEFLKCLGRAGFRSGKMITSDIAILYSYALFLIGRCDHQVSLQRLRVLIARWFFMSTVTNRYTGSYETQVDAEMARLRDLKSADAFCDILERQIGEALTDDFWRIQLPAQLETSAARSPYLFAYYAALNLLGARVLFSDLRVSDLFDPLVRGNKAALERHHLFPRGYLAKRGITSSRDVNQVANYALLEWPDNLTISDQAPSEYAPGPFGKLSDQQRLEMLYWHALPDGWWALDYETFLQDRRGRIAQVIRAGFERIGQIILESTEAAAASISELILNGESYRVEFKSTARWNLEESRKDDRMEYAITRTVAGFLNSGGGTLVVGVSDEKKIIGLSQDYATLQKKDADGFELWLTDLFTRTLGKAATALVEIKIERKDGHEIARIIARASPVTVYLNPAKGERVDEVFVRFGNSTRKLTPREAAEFRDQGAWIRSGGAADQPFDDVEDKEAEVEPTYKLGIGMHIVEDNSVE
jgi:hypothetical protein